MTFKDFIFLDVIIIIEERRCDVMKSPRIVDGLAVLDDLEKEIRDLAKLHGVSVPDPM